MRRTKKYNKNNNMGSNPGEKPDALACLKNEGCAWAAPYLEIVEKCGGVVSAAKPLDTIYNRTGVSLTITCPKAAPSNHLSLTLNPYASHGVQYTGKSATLRALHKRLRNEVTAHQLHRLSHPTTKQTKARPASPGVHIR